MKVTKFGNIVREVKVNVDRDNNPYEFYIAGDHMDSEDLTIHRKGKFSTDDVGPAFTRIFKPGQILYGSRRTYLKKIAVADFEGICANTTFVLETKDDNVFLQSLLPFIMLSDKFTEWSVSHSKGSTNPYVLFSDLASYEFELPSLEEQRVLAEKLWAAYRLKESYKRLLTATDEMVKSQFIEMFGNHSTTPVSHYIAGSYPGEWGMEDKDGSGVKVIRTTNFTNAGKLDLTDVVTRSIIEKKVKRKTIKKFDTILERSGGTAENPVGRVVLFEEDDQYLCNNFTQVLRFKDIDPRYAFYSLFYYYQMNKTAVRSMGSKTTGIQNLDMNRYLEIGIPNASDYEQSLFIAIAEQADKSKFVSFKSQFIEMFGGCANRIKLSSLCSTFVDGDWIESKDQSELGVRLIQTGNVGNGFFKDKEDKSRYISEETFDNLHCTEIYPGDILVSRLPDPIGRACIIPQGIGRTITAVDCTIIRLKDIILPDYFIAYTMTPSYAAQINEVTTGTTRRRVSRANLGNILIPCPSIAKQQQFVAIAKQADKSKYNN